MLEENKVGIIFWTVIGIMVFGLPFLFIATLCFIGYIVWEGERELDDLDDEEAEMFELLEKRLIDKGPLNEENE